MRISEKEFQHLLAKNPQIATQIGIRYRNNCGNKYRNVKVYLYPDGFVSYGEKAEGHSNHIELFDSIKEYERWNELLLLERAGKISQLERQTKLLIQPATKIENTFVREIAYKADFCYNDENGNRIVEDVKPFDAASGKYKTTKDFRIKWKLLQVKYPAYVFQLY